MSRRRVGDPAFSRALDAARSGNAVGFEWLWNRFSRQVAAFATGHGSEDPDGITNETFLGAFRGLDRFDGHEDGFVALLFTIARNKLTDEYRTRGRRPVTTVLDGHVDPVGGNAEEDALRALSSPTRELLGSITDEQREVVLLRLVADLSLEQTALVTGRSVNATKALQHRAMNALRRTISPEAVTK